MNRLAAEKFGEDFVAARRRTPSCRVSKRLRADVRICPVIPFDLASFYLSTLTADDGEGPYLFAPGSPGLKTKYQPAMGMKGNQGKPTAAAKIMRTTDRCAYRHREANEEQQRDDTVKRVRNKFRLQDPP